LGHVVQHEPVDVRGCWLLGWAVVESVLRTARSGMRGGFADTGLADEYRVASGAPHRAPSA
jgi:hypothetical protein